MDRLDRFVVVGLTAVAGVIIGRQAAAGTFGVWSFVAGLLLAVVGAMCAYALGVGRGWRAMQKKITPNLEALGETVEAVARRQAKT